MRLAALALLAACADPPSADPKDAPGDPTDDTAVVEDDTAPPDCPDGTEAAGDDCVDIDECATDNGGCGDPTLWDCENRYAAAPICSFDWTSDHAALTDGVSTLAYGGGLSSRLVVWGEAAFPLAWSGDADIVAAAARVGEGKVLHVGHEGQLDGGLTSGDAGRLVTNAIGWMAPGGGTIGVSSGLDAVRSFLEGEGYTVVTAGPADLDDVAVWITTTYDDHDAGTDDAIRAWITDGGGVIAGGHAWWWAYSTGGDDPYHDHPGNQWLGVAGLTLSGSTAGAAEVAVPAEAPALLHAGRALVAAGRHVDGEVLLDEADAALAADSAGFAASVLPVDSEWFGEARRILDESAPVVPTATTPLVPAAAPVDALVVRIASALAQRLPATELTAHPASGDFPGAVPSDAPRDEIAVTVDASYAGRDGRYSYSGAGAAVWRSTGAYVPPGEVVTVTLPASAVGAGVDLLVGAHTDTLWHKETWERFPQVTRAWGVDATSVDIASAFGGPLYLRVPAGVDLGALDLTVAGAVAMPRFVAGVDEDGDWTGGLRDQPAPWAELATDSFVLTVPAEAVRALDDPTALMAFWQEVLDAQAALAAIDPVRVRAERIVTDRQISAGWMHSGYPVMAHTASAGDLVDLDQLTTTGDWGAFHELGHNHQWRDWNLPGTTEATCNLWSVYTMEAVVGIDRAQGHAALQPGSRGERIDAYVAGGRDFAADWSVWTALETWLQLQEAFGWAPLVAVQEAYLADDPGADPGTDQGRIDRWAVRMSVATGRDLTPFLDAWGMPLSASVQADVAHLPAWTDHPMP